MNDFHDFYETLPENLKHRFKDVGGFFSSKSVDELSALLEGDLERHQFLKAYDAYIERESKMVLMMVDSGVEETGYSDFREALEEAGVEAVGEEGIKTIHDLKDPHLKNLLRDLCRNYFLKRTSGAKDLMVNQLGLQAKITLTMTIDHHGAVVRDCASDLAAVLFYLLGLGFFISFVPFGILVSYPLAQIIMIVLAFVFVWLCLELGWKKCQELVEARRAKQLMELHYENCEKLKDDLESTETLTEEMVDAYHSFLNELEFELGDENAPFGYSSPW
jgi:hypothetical protein